VPEYFAPIEDRSGLPRVLLIGDSISVGYTLPVRALLKDRANVHRIPVNGGPSSRAVARLDQWIGDRKWDVIHSTLASTTGARHGRPAAGGAWRLRKESFARL